MFIKFNKFLQNISCYNINFDVEYICDNFYVLQDAKTRGGFSVNEPTISFSIREDKEKEIKAILTTVYDALRQKGYNPINQIVGYILSEDPTYVTTHNNARSLIRRIDRDELLQILVKTYLND